MLLTPIRLQIGANVWPEYELKWKSSAPNTVLTSNHHVIVMVLEIWYVCFDFMEKIAKQIEFALSCNYFVFTYFNVSMIKVILFN